MKFIETRGNDGKKSDKVEFSEAILSPSASFGGLYIPEYLPTLDDDFLNSHVDSSYKTLALDVLKRFEIDLADDVIEKALSLYDEFDNANEPVPVVKVKDNLFVSELYHGPTRAFKDMALQPFGSILSHLAKQRDEKYLIMAATSGDTGPAALETFKNKENVQVVCLYPDGGTSDVQRLQMVTEDAKNLKVLGINGAFDDAQNALKKLLASEHFNNALEEKGIKLSAANSVNFGRIIFQIIYHIHGYLELVRQNEIGFDDSIYLVVPSGNFGNALGGYYAKKMGLKIEKIMIASNANNVLSDLINSGSYDLRGRSVVNTTSPAMDILKSSNIERVLFDMFGADRTRELMQSLNDNNFYELTSYELNTLKETFGAVYSSDDETSKVVAEYFKNGYLMDPHTATCVKAYDKLNDSNKKTVIYSTAEWTKFSPTILESIGGSKGVHDLDALKEISQKAKIEIPQMISDLFSKEILHKSVIEIDTLEDNILKFLS